MEDDKPDEKIPIVKHLSIYERISVAIYLVLTLGSFAMMIVSSFTHQSAAIWYGLLASLISMMAGFLYGVNRPK